MPRCTTTASSRPPPSAGHGNPEELAAPLGLQQPGTGQPLDEVFGRTVVAAQRPIVEDLHAGDHRSLDDGLEAEPHHLDFG